MVPAPVVAEIEPQPVEGDSDQVKVDAPAGSLVVAEIAIGPLPDITFWSVDGEGVSVIMLMLMVSVAVAAGAATEARTRLGAQELFGAV